MIRRIWIWLRAVLTVAGALILLVTFTPLVPWLGRQLSTNWTDTDRGVLIVLASGTVTYSGPEPNQAIGEGSYWRAIHAIYVWRHAHFRTLLLSGAYSAETIKPFLIANGIPENAILVENRSTTTRENVLFLEPFLAGLSGPFVLLTSDYHMYRASRCFAKEHLSVETLPAPDVLKRANSPIARWQAFWDVCAELVKIAYYRVKGWI
jgi:uncharacterized SAM-binding protein YcdF (DUF218 family)